MNSTERRSKLRIISITSILMLVIDQLSKVWAIHSLKGTPPTSYLGDFFRLGYAENTGAFLGLGKDLPDSVRFVVLTLMVALFLFLLLGYLLKVKTHAPTTYGLSLILAGGVSNLLDRMFRENGHVIDFMNMGLGSLRTGIFNIADMGIMAGLALVLLEPWILKRFGLQTPVK